MTKLQAMEEALKIAKQNFDQIGSAAFADENIPKDSLAIICAKMSARIEKALQMPDDDNNKAVEALKSIMPRLEQMRDDALSGSGNTRIDNLVYESCCNMLEKIDETLGGTAHEQA